MLPSTVDHTGWSTQKGMFTFQGLVVASLV